MRTTTQIVDEIKALQAKDRAYNSLVNEGGEGYEREDSRIAALQDEFLAAAKAEKAAQWTVEIFVARRAAWNAEVAKVAAANGGAVPNSEFKSMVARLGYSHTDLAYAKDLLRAELFSAGQLVAK